MKTETKVFLALVVFFGIVGTIYALVTDPIEWAGTVALLLTAAMCALVAWFFWLSGKSIDARPEDDPDGEISDQAGDFGHFAPYSWWPLFLGLSVTVLVMGVAVGWWLSVIAAPFVVWALVGWTLEYFHGEQAI